MESEFIKRFNERDEIAFRIVFEALYPKFLRYAQKTISSYHDAEDMVLRVFAGLWFGTAVFKKILKFGDIIENGWAAENNPNKFGIVVKARGHSINCTDGKGRFWDLVFDKETKIKIHSNCLNDNYEKIKKARNEPRSIQES